MPFYFNCGRVTLPEALQTQTDFMLAFYGNGGRTIVYIAALKNQLFQQLISIGTSEKVIILKHPNI